MTPGSAVHRIGGGTIANLRLKPGEEKLAPPGISVLLGGNAADAADAMCQAFPDPVQHFRLHQEANVVGSSTAQAIAAAGFLVVRCPTRRLPSHGRITHPLGAAGFTDANLALLSQAFHDTPTPGPTP